MRPKCLRSRRVHCTVYTGQVCITVSQFINNWISLTKISFGFIFWSINNVLVALTEDNLYYVHVNFDCLMEISLPSFSICLFQIFADIYTEYMYYYYSIFFLNHCIWSFSNGNFHFIINHFFCYDEKMSWPDSSLKILNILLIVYNILKIKLI